MFKQIISDALNVISSPSKAFKNVLTRDISVDLKTIIPFIVFMHTYYICLPSYWLFFNVLAAILFFILIGTAYYFSQEITLVYKEDADDKFFYKLAYALSLANVPALGLNLLNNLVNLLIHKSILVALFYASVFNLLIVLLALIYPLKLIAILLNKKHNIRLVIETWLRSFIRSCQEWFGFKACQEMFADYCEN